MDEWGRDPSVRTMRGAFGLMESFQDGLLERLRIDRYDPRLRLWRDRAKRNFEKSWGEAANERIQLSQEQIATLYLRCLADVMRSHGIQIPNGALEASDASRAPIKLETVR